MSWDTQHLLFCQGLALPGSTHLQKHGLCLRPFQGANAFAKISWQLWEKQFLIRPRLISAISRRCHPFLHSKKRVGSPAQWLPHGKCFLESLRIALFAWQGLRHQGMLWTMKTMQTLSPHYPNWRALLQLINALRPFRLDFVVITVLSIPEILQSSAPSTSSSSHCSTWLHIAHGWAVCLAVPHGNFSW